MMEEAWFGLPICLVSLEINGFANESKSDQTNRNMRLHCSFLLGKLNDQEFKSYNPSRFLQSNGQKKSKCGRNHYG